MSRIFSRASVVVATCGALLASPLWVLPALAATNVGDEAALRAAIAAGDDVTLTSNITLTSPIEFPAAYAGTLDGSGFTVTGAMGDANNTASKDQYGMFIVQGTASVTNLTVDGADQWRPFWVKENSTLNLNAGTTVTRGMTNMPQGDGGGVMVTSGATLHMNGSTISDSNASEAALEGSGQGGAIGTRTDATITGKNCTLTNNHTNSKQNTNGGAIFMQQRSTLTLDGCTFSGNSARNVGLPGNQGGAIYVDENSTTTVTNTTFNVAQGFNTGGAIRARGGLLTVRNSKFAIDNLGDGYGISGGAIAVESTHTVIEDSTFTATGTSKVIHAGGFITVVGPQPAGTQDGYPHGFTVRNSSFTGTGAWWNGPATATYGGGIAFESGPSVNNTYTALIENSTFKNMAVDENGGAITIGTKKGEAGGSVNVILRNTTIDNTRTRIAWRDTVGGGVYVGPGHTLTVDGGSQIKDSFAVRGGGIYNDGTVTVTGGSAMSGNSAYQLGGGIYNDGVLTVDAATMTGNVGAENRGYPDKDPREMRGGNIYAHKDVIITPAASFDGNDVRVLDSASNILLTGSLEKQINVSISESPLAKPNAIYDETDRRYIGYTVAKGTAGYTPNLLDARFLHYVTASGTNAAAHDDHDSIGKWDYVSNPEAGTIVLGQRAKMLYHSNQGTFGDNCKEATNATPVTDKNDQLYWVYSSQPKAYTLDPDQKSVTALLPTEFTPCRGDASFAGWYSVAGPHKGVKNTVADEKAFDFTQFFGAKNTKLDGKIVDILDVNELNAYAGWKAEAEVTYEYISAHAADTAAPALPQALKDKALAFNKVGKNAPAFGADVAAVIPDPAEEIDGNYKWVFTKWTENDQDIASTAVTKIEAPHHFVGVWKVQLTKTHEFVSGTANKSLPSDVTDLTPGQGPWQEFDSTFMPTDTFAKEVKVEDGTWTFQAWDKTEVANAKANQHFVGTWVFEALPPVPVTFKVENCLWSDGSTDDIVKDITVTRQGDVISGPLGDIIPTDMTPAEGYEGGTWAAPAPTAEIKITDPTTFTYSCSKILHATHEFKSGTPNMDLPQSIVDGTPVDFDFSMNADVKPGDFTQGLGRSFDVVDGTWTFQAWDKDLVSDAVEDQHFVGTWVFEALPPVPVTFKVENCLWSDGSTDDIVKDITVTRQGDVISGPLGDIIPTDMTPAEGYEGGTWAAPAPTAETEITGAVTFTYSCTAVPPAPEPLPPTPEPVPPTPSPLPPTPEVVPPTPEVVPPTSVTPKVMKGLAVTGTGADAMAVWASALLALGAAGLLTRRRHG